jgi:hypothetical protein
MSAASPDDRPFRDRARPPTAEALARALGRTHRGYATLMRIVGELTTAWTHSKASGWMLKVHDGKKALFYLVPLVDAFTVSMAVRPEEREALLRDESLAHVRERLRAAKKAAEGYVLRFHVDDPSRASEPIEIVERLIAARRRPAR